MDSIKISGSDPSVEEKAIQSLRELIPDIISNNEKFNFDFYLLQWLQARKLNPEKAEHMIRKSLLWRQENQIESGWNDAEFLELIEQYGGVLSTDNKKGPVMYVSMGGKDYKKGINTYGKKDWVLYWARHFAQFEDCFFTYNKERNVEKENINNGSIKKIAVIVDAKDFSAFQVASLDVFRLGIECTKIFTIYFPVVVDTLVYINSNRIFKGAFKVLKPFLTLPYLTLEVYGSDECEWRGRVLQIVDEDQLLKFLEHTLK